MKSKLNKYMEFYNITQKELADGTGINRNTIGRYCNDTFESIPKNHIDLLCSFFKCSLDKLFEVNYDTPIKYPSIVVQQAIINTPFPELLSNIITDVDENFNYKNVISLKVTEEEMAEYNSLSDEVKNELFNKSQERFNSELQLDKSISTFIDIIIEGLFSGLNFDESIKEIFQDSKGYDYFTTNLKVEKFYTYFYRFLNHYSDDKKFIKIIDDIKHVYYNGGLEKLTDDELDRLKNIIELYINEDKQKD